MVRTRQSKERKAKNFKANNNLKPHRLKTDEEVISKITSLHVRLLKPNLTNIIELQKKENVSINFLLNSIVMDFFKNNKEGNLSMSHY